MSGIDIENLEQVVEVSLQDEVIPVGGGGAGVSSFKGRTGAVQPQSGDYTKAMVGLGNVDNTSDADKPVSTATQEALNLKANTSDIPAPYSLPIASQNTLGGIKVGNNLTIDQDGTLNASGGGANYGGTVSLSNNTLVITSATNASGEGY